MFEKPTKIKETVEEKKKKFQILKRTEFYKVFDAGYLIIHLIPPAAVRQYGNTLMHDNNIHRLCIIKRKCVTASGSGNTSWNCVEKRVIGIPSGFL